MPDQDSLTTIETHSNESATRTVSSGARSDGHTSESNSHLGRRYSDQTPLSFTQNHPEGSDSYSPLDELKSLFSEEDFGCDIRSFNNVERLGPDLSSRLKDTEGETIPNNLGPNLIPPDVSEVRGAFEATADNETIAISEELVNRSTAYFQDATNNPRQSTNSTRIKTLEMLERRRPQSSSELAAALAQNPLFNGNIPNLPSE